MAELKELRNRIVTFFQTQPNRIPVGLDAIAEEFDSDDLKKLIPEELSADALDKAVKEKRQVPEDKSERKDYGRKKVFEDEVERLTREGIIKRCSLNNYGGTGMGYRYEGDLPEDKPEGQTAKVVKLPIDQIRIDPKIQQRDDGIDPKTVDEYALVVESLPPARVFKFKDLGEWRYILSRGFHRIAAWKKAGWDTIPVEVYEGDREAALLDAVGDNASHGRRRTGRDIVKAVRSLLSCRAYKNSSTAQVAQAAQIAWGTADKIMKKISAEERAEAAAKNQPAPEAPATRKGKDGKTYSANKKKATASKKAPPTVTAPKSPGPVPSSGVKDKTGADVPNEVAAIFMDTRFADTLRSMRELIGYSKDVRGDYAVSSLNVEARNSLFGEMYRLTETLALSLPYAAIPAGADVKTEVSRRKFMTESEYTEWVKKGRKMKKAAEPVATETPDTLPMETTSGNGAVPESAAG